MSSKIKEKIDEISLLLLMTSDGDEPGIALLAEMLKDLASLAEPDSAHARLLTACKWLSDEKGQISNADFIELLKEFLSCAQIYFDNPSGTKFPNERKETKNEIEDKVDTTFLAEFIETHSMQLEEFEGSLLEAEFGTGSNPEFETGLKRYIHTLKGDAGSVGLNQISHVCHEVEDMLISRKPQELVGQLVLFKEWVCACLKSYTAGETPTENAQSFMERFKKASGVGAAEKASVESSKNAVKVESAPAKPVQVQSSLGEYRISGESDLLIEFIVEAEEHLNNVESIVLNAAGDYDKGAIDTIFRGVHSIKGGSAYFNLEEMTKTSHLLENMLSEVRDGKRTLDPVLSNLVLSYIDLQKSMLTTARQAREKDGVISRTQAAKDFLGALEAYIAGKALDKPSMVQPKVQPVNATGTPQATATTSNANAVSTKSDSSGADADAKDDKLNLKTFVKIDTGRLDHLIDSIGEMVIYSSMLIRHCRQHLQENREVIDVTRRVEKFARDLQDVGMSMRLMPIKGLFQKMSRLVWDTSRKIGKQIDFSMDGEDTELDRNLIDKLADPLMHMVRNAIDHGIEPPEEREKAGKSRTGAVHLSASHSGGTVLIKVRDDGRGLNQEKLLAKALEKKIITEGQKLSEQEIYQLIFAPGFSTAAVVTDISGRGVGMDVVRKNVESLRGRVNIESVLGKGSVFTIELPLTLAIIDGIQIRVGRDQFIVPSLSIVEFVRPKEDMLSYPLDRGETFHFRGKYLPVFRLADLFGIEAEFKDALDATYIIVEHNQELVALMVDDILGEYSTVIKSLGAMFDDNLGLSGCAIMPNGDVALILDIRSLVVLARTGYKRISARNENTTKVETQESAESAIIH